METAFLEPDDKHIETRNSHTRLFQMKSGILYGKV